MNSSDMLTEKIIFWDEGGFIAFLLANSLQKKIDGEFYAIFDVTDRKKPFYQKQKLVDFKKIWFFHDRISAQNQTPDIKYLENFEKIFEINIWKLAINERIFYKPFRCIWWLSSTSLSHFSEIIWISVFFKFDVLKNIFSYWVCANSYSILVSTFFKKYSKYF